MASVHPRRRGAYHRHPPRSSTGRRSRHQPGRRSAGHPFRGNGKRTAERPLEEAQVTIRDLQTKLAHEHLAKNEALEAAQLAVTGEQSIRQTTIDRGRTDGRAVGAPEH